MESIGVLLLLLLAARVFGMLAERLLLPSAVGEMVAGMVLISTAQIFLTDQVHIEELRSSEALAHVADLGIFFLVLMAGVEMQLNDTLRDARESFVVALGGVLLPFATGIFLGFVFFAEAPEKPALVLLLGVAISITAIAASAKILLEFGLLHTKLGRVLITAALFDDIFGLFLLALLSSVIVSGGFPGAGEFLIMLIKVIAFFVITGLLGVHVYPHISKRIHRKEAAAIEFGVLVMVALAYGFLAELLGLHWAVGAFMAGLFMERSRIGKRPYKSMRLILNALTAGVLGPLFFAWIGLQADLTAVTEVPLFLAVLIMVAFGSKVLGGGIAARSIGYKWRESLVVGVGLAPRGEIMIVILSVALGAGLMDVGTSDPAAYHLFSALIVMALVNTALAPLVLRLLLRSRD